MTEENKKGLINYRLNRARETINEIDSLVTLQFYNNAINRIYYACFYAVNALLIKQELTAKTHDGVRQMFGLHFIKTGIFPKNMGRFYTNLFEKRITGDYDDYISYNREDVDDFLTPAKDFISTIELFINAD